MAESYRCPQCGAEVPGDAPQGLCPNCVLKAGFGTQQTDSVSQAGSESTSTRTFEAQFVPPTPAELAPHFPDLEIMEMVGRGGMGVVYKARQKRLDRLVALKILSPKIGQDPAFAARFVREARAMAMLSHPHIVAVYDFGQTSSPLAQSGKGAGGEGGFYYFLMEFVDGVNLRRLLDTGKLAPEEALAIVPQICDALQYAHDHGVVHRDIKPENVLLDKEGLVKIADFGIAKLVGKEAKDLTLTGAGQIIGTPQYMAPEQIEHPLQVDHRADIYSLGVVFYQMLTGELPIGRFAPPSKKVQIDVRLDEVVLRALEKEPDRRYQQASEVKTQVDMIVTSPSRAQDDNVKPADAAQASHPGVGVSHADGKDRYWRVFGVPLVGVRDGQRVVHWPGVCLFVAIMVVGGPLTVILAHMLIALVISVASPGPRMGPSPLLLLSDIILVLALYAGWGLGIVMLIVKIRQGLAAPMKGLPHLNAERSPAPPDSGARADLKFNGADIEHARRQVKGPAIGLMVTGILNWVATPLIVLVLFYIISANSSNPVSAVGLIPALILNLIFSSLMIFGALKMKRLQAYNPAIGASIAAIIVTPGNVIGLPIGISALVVLSQREVREAFRKNRRAKCASISTPVTYIEKMIGMMALVMCLSGIPLTLLLAVLIGRNWSVWTFLALIFSVIFVAFLCGIFGWKSVAGKVAVIISVICLLIALPFLGVVSYWESARIRRDFGGWPSFVHKQLNAAKANKQAAVDGANYPGGSRTANDNLRSDIASAPTITVETTYPGASALVMADTVAAPIEQQINGVENMLHMRSRSSNQGTYWLQITFERGIDLDAARLLVQRRVNLALPMLPDAVSRSGVKVKKKPASGAMPQAARGPAVCFGVYGPEQEKVRQMAEKLVERLRESGKLADLRATSNLIPSLNVDIDHTKAAALGVALSDISEVLNGQPSGSRIEGGPDKQAADIAKLIVRNNKGEMVPLRGFVTLNMTMAPDVLDRFDLYPMVEITANPASGITLAQVSALYESLLEETRKELQLPDVYRTTWLYTPLPAVEAKTVETESKSETTTATPNHVRQFSTGQSVNTIACSADGKLIAIANGNPTFPLNDGWKPLVEILDAQAGNSVISLKLTTDDKDTLLAATERVPHFIVGALAFSPDGNVVAVETSIGQVKLFNARTGELLRSLDDGQEKLADKKTPEKFISLKRVMGSVASLAFSPDGSLLATCGRSFDDVPLVRESMERLGRSVTGPGRLKVWEVKTGTLKHDLVGHSYVAAVMFSPDGKLLASAGSWETNSDWGTGVIIWNPQTGAKIRTFGNKANGSTWAVAFSPNSKLVVYSSRTFDKDNDTSTSAIGLLHAGTGITEWTQTVSGWAHPAVFSPDGKSVAVLCGGQSIRFLDTDTGTVMHEIRSADSPQGGRWNYFAIAPQGRMLTIGGVDNERKGSVEIWDIDGLGGDTGDRRRSGTSQRVDKPSISAPVGNQGD